MVKEKKIYNDDSNRNGRVLNQTENIILLWLLQKRTEYLDAHKGMFKQQN